MTAIKTKTSASNSGRIPFLPAATSGSFIVVGPLLLLEVVRRADRLIKPTVTRRKHRAIFLKVDGQAALKISRRNTVFPVRIKTGTPVSN